MLELELVTSAANPDLEALVQQVTRYLQASKAARTRKAYASDLVDFRGFCAAHRLPALPSTPEAVALYAAHLARHAAPATIRRRLAAITHAHREAGFAVSPASAANQYLVREVLKGINRTHGISQQGKDPLLADAIQRLAAACPAQRIGARDRALLLVGFAGAFRRSELAGLELGDLEFTDQGLLIRLRRSKTDQEQAGRKVAIPYGTSPATCPVRAMRAWLQTAGIVEGPVFRGVDRHGRVGRQPLCLRSIAKILKHAARRAGIEAANISGHSLRAGMATQAARNGAGEREIARTTGHHSVTMVRRYIRDADPFRSNASARLGL